MNRKELMFNCDMIQGCINRMMVTDNQEELDRMFIGAITGLNTIYTENKKRLLEVENGQII